MNPVGYSVFNDNDEFCGCVIYGRGANNNISKPFNLPQGRVIELTRMALNGKHGETSKVLAVSLRLIKKDIPFIDIVVSFADHEQGHKGVIYQASNWIYLGESKRQREVLCPETGKLLHKRVANSRYGTIKGLEKTKIMFKHKYVYAYDKKMRNLLLLNAMPYPK